MAKLFCTGCSASLMSSMRVCPSCGGKAFSASPPSISASITKPAILQTVPTGRAASMHARGRFEPAGHWQRVGAFSLDALFLAIVGGITYGLSSFLGSNGSGVKFAPAVGLMFWVSIPYIYFTIFHSSSKRATWGKSVVGIIVVTDQGEQLTKVQAFVRVLLQNLLPIAAYLVLFLTIGNAFSFANEEMKTVMGLAIILGVLAISLGPFIIVFFSPRHQTLFDLICRTRVIKKTSP